CPESRSRCRSRGGSGPPRSRSRCWGGSKKRLLRTDDRYVRLFCKFLFRTEYSGSDNRCEPPARSCGKERRFHFRRYRSWRPDSWKNHWKIYSHSFSFFSQQIFIVKQHMSILLSLYFSIIIITRTKQTAVVHTAVKKKSCCDK